MEPHTEATPVPPLASVPLPRTRPALAEAAGPPQHPRSPDPASGHTASTTERGSFCLAVCTCGWTGPARRSRDLARKDATRHTAG
ncbi:hypothetical protein ACFWTC_28080 [Streptomyces sp. NPDC058619]|uniref:hypothetical protein n=1 Tax=unclassified Streptomyces TaxID=2593676 RepID=UPI00364CA6EB